MRPAKDSVRADREIELASVATLETAVGARRDSSAAIAAKLTGQTNDRTLPYPIVINSACGSEPGDSVRTFQSLVSPQRNHHWGGSVAANAERTFTTCDLNVTFSN